MTDALSSTDIKRRFKALESWATTYTHRLEATLQDQTQWKRIHCFVMDQFQEAFADEHVSRDQKFVFIFLRVAIDLKDQDLAVVQQVKAGIQTVKASFQILNESFHETTHVIDLDWHVSEMERDEDQGDSFANRVLADCLRLIRHLESANAPSSHLPSRESSLE
ncbi:MAG: hypothetical protein H7318_16940 [Oligoflexus sp.]|nr:hypothetical protein [Oligoflexus sp.]